MYRKNVYKFAKFCKAVAMASVGEGVGGFGQWEGEAEEIFELLAGIENGINRKRLCDVHGGDFGLFDVIFESENVEKVTNDDASKVFAAENDELLTKAIWMSFFERTFTKKEQHGTEWLKSLIETLRAGTLDSSAERESAIFEALMNEAAVVYDQLVTTTGQIASTGIKHIYDELLDGIPGVDYSVLQAAYQAPCETFFKRLDVNANSFVCKSEWNNYLKYYHPASADVLMKELRKMAEDAAATVKEMASLLEDMPEGPEKADATAQLTRAEENAVAHTSRLVRLDAMNQAKICIAEANASIARYKAGGNEIEQAHEKQNAELEATAMLHLQLLSCLEHTEKAFKAAEDVARAVIEHRRLSSKVQLGDADEDLESEKLSSLELVAANAAQRAEQFNRIVSMYNEVIRVSIVCSQNESALEAMPEGEEQDAASRESTVMRLRNQLLVKRAELSNEVLTAQTHADELTVVAEEIRQAMLESVEKPIRALQSGAVYKMARQYSHLRKQPSEVLAHKGIAEAESLVQLCKKLELELLRVIVLVESQECQTASEEETLKQMLSQAAMNDELAEELQSMKEKWKQRDESERLESGNTWLATFLHTINTNLIQAPESLIYLLNDETIAEKKEIVAPVTSIALSTTTASGEASATSTTDRDALLARVESLKQEVAENKFNSCAKEEELLAQIESLKQDADVNNPSNNPSDVAEITRVTQSNRLLLKDLADAQKEIITSRTVYDLEHNLTSKAPKPIAIPEPNPNSLRRLRR